MAKAFFMGWPMWEKLTFVLACAIFVTVACAAVKLAYNHYRLRKFTTLEREKREQSLHRQMSQRQRPRGEAAANDVPFGVRAIESGVEVEGVWISRPNTPDSQSGQSSPGSLPPKEPVQRNNIPDLEKGLTRIQTRDLGDLSGMAHDRSTSKSTNTSATPASSGHKVDTLAGGMHDSHATRDSSPDAGITKPPRSRHPPCSYSKYSGSPYLYKRSPTVNTLEGLEAIHRASTNVNADGGSGSSESGSGGDDPGPISAAAPALLSNGRPANRTKHQSADLIMLDTHRISQAAETGQLTPKVRRPGQSRDSSVASVPQSATTPTDYFDYQALRQRQSLQNGADVNSPTNTISSPKIDALPIAVRRSSMPDVTPFAKFCQTAPPSPTSPRLDSGRRISQESTRIGRPPSAQSRYYAAPATPLASNPPTPPPPAQSAQQEEERPSFERRESQVLRGHGSGFEILKRGSFPVPVENPLERQKAMPPVSLQNTYDRSRSRSTGPGNKLQKKRRASADSQASSESERNGRNSRQ
ncbi:hypothetical protein Tdes44962_MAKER03073 [Teratosphaeria destructans]|uniref:Uncharacterized protein n=1 Tax=Teratosphaeria destructans TaxID=418781 RepID=A0A9W7SQX2_9PEZI|nr:hypothetical protein Tdes44962_MAKER03073 [Teratosphaeria destructans]